MPFKIYDTHVNYSNVLDYLFYLIFLFLRNVYLFIINLPWTEILFWARIIAVIIVVLCIIGIIYNLIGISRAKNKKREEEL
jgi:uncharacterized membrane protein